MHTVDYFLKALRNNAHLERDWVISCFSVSEHKDFDITPLTDLYDFQLVTKTQETDKLFFIDPEDKNNPIPLEEYQPKFPLMSYQTKVILKPDDLPNVDREIQTTYGNCLFNAIALIYPFGKKIAFMTGKIKGSTIENMVAAKLKDTPKEGESRDPSFFYVDELVKHADALTSLEAYSFTCVPTTSEKTMVANPEVIKLRDKLLKEHAHELDKPAVIANIQEQMVALDKQSFKGDRAEGFYLKDKSYSISRMRKFGMLGLIGGFGGNKPSLVTTSLEEGWKKKDMPVMADDIRNGSYSRGKSTAVAGFGVKLVNNAFQTVTINLDDCGVKKGMDFTISESNYGDFNGRYMITPNGLVELDDKVTRALIGKTITVRTPMLCKQTPPSFCAKCAGKSISLLPNSVHITASNINSIYMNAVMKSMHGKSLSTKRYNYQDNNQ